MSFEHSAKDLLDFIERGITHSGQCIIGECKFNIDRTFFALDDINPWYSQWIQWQQIYITIATLTYKQTTIFSSIFKSKDGNAMREKTNYLANKFS